MRAMVYIKADKNIRVAVRDVCVGDLGEIWCSSQETLDRCRALCLMHMEEDRRVISVMDAVKAIERNVPETEVCSLGETDLVVEYKPKQEHCAVWEWIKFAAVWMMVFWGSAFAIATFNEDVSVLRVFQIIHLGITGQQRTGFTWLEGGYAAGLALGILIFYNHISKRKEISDPTPLEVEMRSYEKEMYTAIADHAKRNREKNDTKEEADR